MPVAHAVALRLQAIGVDVGIIAAALDIPPKNVATVLELAQAKLDRLMRGS
jgi:hypothetical protein